MRRIVKLHKCTTDTEVNEFLARGERFRLYERQQTLDGLLFFIAEWSEQATQNQVACVQSECLESPC